MAQQSSATFAVKRVYDAPDPGDGARILVDRLRPRGISKQQAHIDEWVKADEEHRQGLEQLRESRAGGPVILLTAVKDLAHSHIPVLLARFGEELPAETARAADLS